jgi:hypothetical protein
MADSTLAGQTLKIGDVQCIDIGNDPEVAPMLGHGVENRGHLLRKSAAQFLYDRQALKDIRCMFAFIKTHRFVQRDAKHAVRVFEVSTVFREEESFSVRQDRAPILPNRVIPAGLNAGQKFSPKKVQIIAKRILKDSGLLRQVKLGRYTPRLSSAE